MIDQPEFEKTFALIHTHLFNRFLSTNILENSKYSVKQPKYHSLLVTRIDYLVPLITTPFNNITRNIHNEPMIYLKINLLPIWRILIATLVGLQNS